MRKSKYKYVVGVQVPETKEHESGTFIFGIKNIDSLFEAFMYITALSQAKIISSYSAAELAEVPKSMRKDIIDERWLFNMVDTQETKKKRSSK